MTDAEITRAVAEKVMDLTLRYLISPDGTIEYDADSFDVPGDYLNDDRDACAVLDKMSAEYDQVTVRTQVLDGVARTFCDVFRNNTLIAEYRIERINGEARRMCICIAALRANGVDVE